MRISDWSSDVCSSDLDIAARTKAGQQVAVVSSGAIALGARRLGLARDGRATLEDAQAAAATGQIALSQVWAEVLGAEGLTAAQMLVTLGDLEHRRRYLNAAATLDRLLSLRVVPVINENDSVATEEIRFGDNDRLAARVAQAAGAGGVILLSDIDGLYDRNPAQPGAQQIARVERIAARGEAMADGGAGAGGVIPLPELDCLYASHPAQPGDPHSGRRDRMEARVEAMAGGGTASGMGSGGMVSKIAAARIANAAGAHLAIASGHGERPLSADARYTIFVAEKGASARKAWLAGGLTASGRPVIDRSEERRVGKEGVRTCRARGSP